MKAFVLSQPQKITFREIESPEIKNNLLRVKIIMAGICGSDIHLFKGDRKANMDLILGHEAIGKVVEIGKEVINFKMGDRVVIEPNIACGECSACKRGFGKSCLNKKIIGVNSPGCFAEEILIEKDYAWKIPNSISDRDAVLIEPMAVSYRALKLKNSEKNDHVAIIGLGAIGIILADLAIKKGFKVWVNDINSDKINKALELGAKKIVVNNPDFFEEQGIETIYDCVGNPALTSKIIQEAAVGSEIILVGLSEESSHFDSLSFARKSLTLKGAIIYEHPNDFEDCIQLIENKIILPSKYISEEFDFHQIPEAFARACEPASLKVVIKNEFFFSK